MTQEKDLIPLTASLLLAAGAKQDDWRYYLGDFRWSDRSKLLTWKSHPLEHIKYLHQFQNLYSAMTGNELTITPIN